MKTLDLSLSAIFAGCVAMAACSQATGLSRLNYTPSVTEVPGREISPLTFRVLYGFSNTPDGAWPETSVVRLRSGAFYGTTTIGGAYCRPRGCGGTVFAVTPGGKEKVLHSFGSGTDGSGPRAGLVNVRGMLYGTTYYGGAHDGGTVFSIRPGGTEKVLHSFKGRDGRNPSASLILVGGVLYGTTIHGGAHNQGTIFSITTSGVERVLLSFEGLFGAYPVASLIDVGGMLYGTTLAGGEYGGPSGYGTVFSITLGGKEKVLHSFSGPPDGSDPGAGLVDVRGTLYGTTGLGGTNLCSVSYSKSCGTVFSITPGGNEKVLHSFGSGTDGIVPVAGLVNVRGTLYGTTLFGGTHRRGAVFSITTGGTEKVLHSFSKGNDGEFPKASLIDLNGMLYGTTYQGGSGACRLGCGTVFSLTP